MLQINLAPSSEEWRKIRRATACRNWQRIHQEQVKAKRKERYALHKEEMKAEHHAWNTSPKGRKYYRDRYHRIRATEAGAEKIREIRRKARRKACGAKNPTGELKFGQCEVCGQNKKLRYDHDHVTGEHRGWLCDECNRGLGVFHDDLKRLENAIAYLRKNER